MVAPVLVIASAVSIGAAQETRTATTARANIRAQVGLDAAPTNVDPTIAPASPP
jgi:hypothetical protein